MSCNNVTTPLDSCLLSKAAMNFNFFGSMEGREQEIQSNIGRLIRELNFMCTVAS